jgi:hypothetical protein
MMKSDVCFLIGTICWLTVCTCRVVKELQSRFKYLMETGDDSKIPGDLEQAILTTVSISIIARRKCFAH